MSILIAFIVSGCNSRCDAINDCSDKFVVCQFNMRFILENDGLVLERKKLPNGKIKVVYDGSQTWEKRAPLIEAFLKYNDVDICGTQELRKEQVEFFDKIKPEFEYFGMPSIPQKYNEKDSCANNIIIYKKSRFELLQKGDFWLSDTPEQVSNSFEAPYPRNCNWGKFKDKNTGKIFYFFNTHIHHIGVENQEKSAKLILRKIREIAGETPLFLTGDFNMSETHIGMKHFFESDYIIDARQICKTSVYGSTFTDNFGYTGKKTIGFPTVPEKIKQQSWIDWVFVSKNINVFKYGVLAECYNGVWLSDHYPLLLKVSINK